LVLGFIGGGLGFVLALEGVSIFDSAVQDPGKPYWIVFEADAVVFGYVAAVCVATAIIFDLAPALHVSRSNNNDVLKDSGRSTAGSGRLHRLKAGIVIAQLSLSLVLLVGAGLIFRSFMKLYTLDVGFPTSDLLTTRLQLPISKYASPEARRAFFDDLESRLGALPGIDSTAATTGVPPLDGGERLLEIDRPNGGAEPHFVSVVTITPKFFETLRAPVLTGRSFNDTDGAAGSETVIINQRLASQYFQGEDPIGKRLRFTRRDSVPGLPPPVWRTIVGVSPLIRHGSPDNAYFNAVVYIPYRHETPSAASLLIRTALPPATVIDTIRREVQMIDRDQPVFSIRTMDDALTESRWPYRVFGSLFATFAGIALVLSSVGLYAVMAYSVSQRTQEIGVRMALGAQRLQVSWLILKRGLVQLTIGLALGLAGALALSRVLQGVLFDVTPSDPITFAATTIILSLISIAACLLPAIRATRIDPLSALRTE
jgi:putative ABC transport system permease protein